MAGRVEPVEPTLGAAWSSRLIPRNILNLSNHQETP